MPNADAVIAELARRGELWESMPGSIGLRGATLSLFERIEAGLRALSGSDASTEWRMPAALPLEVLARADYFASFPQWLTLISHLGDDEARLTAIAMDPDPARAAAAPTSANAALSPAICYHAYAALAGRTLDTPMVITAQGSCWRHEGAHHAALERGWSFTMREIVCIGSERETADFVQRTTTRTRALAHSLGLDGVLEEASDPFFAPTARGKAMLQQLKGLKQELRLSVGGNHSIAVASFNRHEKFFGSAFDIRDASGETAETACVAFGLERWLLAFLCAHGIEPQGWPPAVAAGSG